MRKERCGNCEHFKRRTSECRYGGDVDPEDARCHMYERSLKEAEKDGELEASS